MSGADLMARIRTIAPRMTFIAVSGYDVPDLMRRVAALGTFACMRKPFEPARLVETIARARGRRQ
jgi:DNA-binding NtrC family response regulator